MLPSSARRAATRPARTTRSCRPPRSSGTASTGSGTPRRAPPGAASRAAAGAAVRPARSRPIGGSAASAATGTPRSCSADDVEQRAQGRVHLDDPTRRVEHGHTDGHQRGEVGEARAACRRGPRLVLRVTSRTTPIDAHGVPSGPNSTSARQLSTTSPGRRSSAWWSAQAWPGPQRPARSATCSPSTAPGAGRRGRAPTSPVELLQRVAARAARRWPGRGSRSRRGARRSSSAAQRAGARSGDRSGPCGFETGRFDEVADGRGPAQSSRDGGRCLRGRRRRALDDPERGLPRTGDQTERPGPGRRPGTRPRRTGGGQLDGRLVALAGRREGRAVSAAGPTGGAVEEAAGCRRTPGHRRPRRRPPRSGHRGSGGPDRTGRPGCAPAAASAATRVSREANSAASGCGSVPYRACWARCRSTRATGSSGSGTDRPAPWATGAVRVGSVHVRAAVLGHGHLPGWWCRPSLVQRATGRHDPPDSPDRPTPHRGRHPQSVTARRVRARNAERSAPIGRTGPTAPGTRQGVPVAAAATAAATAGATRGSNGLGTMRCGREVVGDHREDRVGRGELHRLGDPPCARVERAAEHAGERQHVVDLVREVAAARGDDRGVAGARRPGAPRGPGWTARRRTPSGAISARSVLGQPRAGQADEHVGAGQRLGDAAGDAAAGW